MTQFFYQSKNDKKESAKVGTMDFFGTISSVSNETKKYYQENDWTSAIQNSFQEWFDEQSLFNNKGELKILISKIAMHMKEDFRKDLFVQIDELLSEENFTEDDNLISVDSFAGFLMFFGLVPKIKTPSLTVTHEGNIATSWLDETVRLHVEFLPNRLFRTAVSRRDLGEKELLGHQGSIKSLETFLVRNQLHKVYANE